MSEIPDSRVIQVEQGQEMLHIMRHTLGLTEPGEEFRRNLYWIKTDSYQGTLVYILVGLGLMHSSSPEADGQWFSVTEKGRAMLWSK